MKKWIAAAVVALLLALAWWLRPRPAAPPALAPPPPPARWLAGGADASAAPPVFTPTPREGFVVSGAVEDSGGGPVRGARVVAIQSAGESIVRFAATTDERGRYALTLRGGLYSLLAEADGYPRKSRFLSLAADTTVSFRLDPAAQLLGRVVMNGTGEPVPAAKVRAVPVERAGYRRPGVETDAEGRFRLDAMAGEWRLEARKGALVGSTGVLRVIPALAITGLEVRVDAAFTLSGRVLGPQRAGVPGVGVVAEPRGSTGGANASTAADGSFRIEGLPPGRYDLTASTWREGSVRTYGEATIVDRDVAVELTLPAPAIVEGRVAGGTGRVQVVAAMGEGDVSRGSIAVADASGGFSFRGVDPGRVSLRAEADGLVATWGPEVVAPGARVQVTLSLTAGASLSGSVSFADGAPVPGATVTVLSPDERRGRASQATTGPDGRYLVSGLVPGWARAAAHRTRTLGLDGAARLELAGATTRDFTLPRPGVITGAVLLSDGRPAVGALVVASGGAQKPPPTHPLRATADADGSFTLDDLDTGATYHLWADAPDHTAHATAPAGTKGLVLKLAP